MIKTSVGCVGIEPSEIVIARTDMVIAIVGILNRLKSP